MRATVCWGSIRNSDCILYPGAGTVVLIRPAQTFYERINFADLKYQGVKRRTRWGLFLERTDGLISWQDLEDRVHSFYPKAVGVSIFAAGNGTSPLRPVVLQPER